MKYYTEDGNWDLVGNNTPVFFIRDGIKFPDFIHSQKQDPHTNRQEPDNVWDFFSHSPEATHQFTWLFGDRGIPASYRNMDGFGSHTFQWVNAEGERFWVKFHFKTDQGIKTLHIRRSRRHRRAGSVPLPQGPVRRDRRRRLPVVDAQGAGDAGGRRGRTTGSIRSI